MSTDIKTILNNQMPTGNRPSKEEPVREERPALGAVDGLADNLATEYDNWKFRPWYCGVIYEFGLAKTEEWRRRASEGRAPQRLFSTYVKQARKYKPRGLP